MYKYIDVNTEANNAIPTRKFENPGANTWHGTDITTATHQKNTAAIKSLILVTFFLAKKGWTMFKYLSIFSSSNVTTDRDAKQQAISCTAITISH